MTNAERTYFGFRIRKTFPSGYWTAVDIIDGHRVELRADTLDGVKAMVRERLAD